MQVEIVEFKAAQNLVKSIRTRAANLDRDIHTAAVSGMAHYKEHNDASIMTDLVKAVSAYNIKSGKFDGRSVRGASLRKWIEDFGGLKWSKNAYGKQGGFVFNKQLDKQRIDIDVQDAMAQPFWSYTSDEVKDAKEVSPMDMMRKVRDQIRKIAAGESEKQVFSSTNMANATTIVNSITELLAQVENGTIDAKVIEGETVQDETTDKEIAELMARAS